MCHQTREAANFSISNRDVGGLKRGCMSCSGQQSREQTLQQNQRQQHVASACKFLLRAAWSDHSRKASACQSWCNPVLGRKSNEKRDCRSSNINPVYRLDTSLRARIRVALSQPKTFKSANSNDVLSCTAKGYSNYLEQSLQA